MTDISTVVEFGPNLAFVMYTLAVAFMFAALFRAWGERGKRCYCGSCKSECERGR